MNLTLYFALEQYIPINTHFSGLSPFGEASESSQLGMCTAIAE